MDRSETHMQGTREHMTFVSIQHMPLGRAYLCEDCNCVGNRAEQCPVCASEALMSLAGVLNREQPKEKVRMTYAQINNCFSLL
jgi:hypothetical protein